MTELRGPYVSYPMDTGRSYGGSQSWSACRDVRAYGCGLVACCDVLHYLALRHPDCSMDFGSSDYGEVLALLRKKYFPIFPLLGMNGWLIAKGLRHYFRDYGVPLKASWGVGRRRVWQKAEEMLTSDIPVVLCIGPSLGRDRRIGLYAGREDALPACRVSGHYVTVTALDGEWARVSSWGKAYWLRREEYDRSALPWFSDIAYIRSQ